MSAASFVEISMIIESRYGADGVHDLDLFIAKAQITLVPVEGQGVHAGSATDSKVWVSG